MPQREWSSTASVFGFNGQLKDDEVCGAGNSYAFEYRMHDPRLGRFWSTDPISYKYPWNSPYAFAENRVIDGRDLEGREWTSATAVNEWLNGHNAQNGTDITIERMVAAGYWKTHTTVSGEQLVFVGESQVQKNSWTWSANGTSYEVFNVKAFASESKLEILGRDGSIKTFTANEKGMVELPVDDPNTKNTQYTIGGDQLYETYNRNDIPGVKDQWLKTDAMASLINGVLDYQNTYPGEQLQIGDLNGPDLKEYNYGGAYHHGGSAQVDIRLLSNSGGSKQGTWDQMGFDSQRSAVLFDAMKANGFNNVWLAPGAAKKVRNVGTTMNITDDSRHNDHYHFQKYSTPQ